MKLSVCIPTVRADVLLCAVHSIVRQTWPDWELLVVAQGTDAALEAVCAEAEALDSRVRVLRLPQKGTSRARNAGMQAAQGEIIAFMDDDCEAAPDWLATLTECFAQDADVGAVGGVLLPVPARRPGLSFCHSAQPKETRYDPSAMPDVPDGYYWAGANVAFRRTVAAQVGPFDECLGPGTPFPAAEDTDYTMRLDALSIVVRTTPRAVMHHTHGRRYGLRAILKHFTNYAAGIGGFHAKRALMGDTNWPNPVLKLHLSPSGVKEFVKQCWQHKTLLRAYDDCLAHYRVNDSGLLERKPAD